MTSPGSDNDFLCNFLVQRGSGLLIHRGGGGGNGRAGTVLALHPGGRYNVLFTQEKAPVRVRPENLVVKPGSVTGKLLSDPPHWPRKLVVGEEFRGSPPHCQLPFWYV
eukprot:gene11517-biopygen2667